MASLQSLDVTSLKAVLAEWRRLLLPSRLEKAQQAGPGTIQLGLRHLQGMQWLELSWQAEAARVHAIAPPPRARVRAAPWPSSSSTGSVGWPW